MSEQEFTQVVIKEITTLNGNGAYSPKVLALDISGQVWIWDWITQTFVKAKFNQSL